MFRRAALLSGLGLLAGCGFQPIYRSASGEGPGPSADLAAIEVRPIYERPGQLLREALKARLASDTGAPRRYDLQVSFSVAGEPIGILNSTQVTRVRLTGASTWALLARDAKQTRLASGSERIIDGFDLFDSQYFAADLDTEQVQRRIAERMATMIATRLAVWFHQHPAGVG